MGEYSQRQGYLGQSRGHMAVLVRIPIAAKRHHDSDNSDKGKRLIGGLSYSSEVQSRAILVRHGNGRQKRGWRRSWEAHILIFRHQEVN